MIAYILMANRKELDGSEWAIEVTMIANNM